MTRQESRGSAGEYQTDEQAGVAIKLQSLTRPNIGEAKEQPYQSFIGVETETCLVASTKAKPSDPALGTPQHIPTETARVSKDRIH